MDQFPYICSWGVVSGSLVSAGSVSSGTVSIGVVSTESVSAGSVTRASVESPTLVSTGSVTSAEVSILLVSTGVGSLESQAANDTRSNVARAASTSVFFIMTTFPLGNICFSYAFFLPHSEQKLPVLFVAPHSQFQTRGAPQFIQNFPTFLVSPQEHAHTGDWVALALLILSA